MALHAIKVAAAIVPAVLLTAGCMATGGYKPVSDNLPALKVSFADPAWTGKSIPAGQQCEEYGGKGATPALKVENIPAGANAIIVEYNDLSFGPRAVNGGHGTIGYWIKVGDSATLPSVPGNTEQLADGSFVEAKTRNYSGYLPPCSGGRGNTYAADVKAVYKATKEGEENRLLARQRITLGTY